MRRCRLPIPSPALAAILTGSRSAPLTVEALIHTDAQAAASFIPESQAPLELFAAEVFARIAR